MARFMTEGTNKNITRRRLLGIAAAAAGYTLAGPTDAATSTQAELETTTIRLLFDSDFPVLCYAPQYLAEEFLSLEGFTDIQYVDFGDKKNDAEVLTSHRADISAGLGSDFIVAIDKGAPMVVLGGLHAGCVEVFANDSVRNIRDLGGRRILATGPGGPEHLFLSGLATFVGVDPRSDIEWVWEPDYSNWANMFAAGTVDVLNAFPPQNHLLRERRLGRVILNTTTDDPWRNFFCCMIGANKSFVEANPEATRRALRALIKANQLCEQDRERSARRLVEIGASSRYDFALRTLQEVPYAAWRDYDPKDTLRFFSLRLREAGFLNNSPRDIIEAGTDFSFIESIKRELRT